MPTRRLLPLLVLAGLAIGLLACNLTLPPTDSTSPTPAGTSFPLPQTEADAPRVTAQEAKAALDAGLAIIVDVRSADSYASGHIAGARSIPLDRIEDDPAGISLDPSKWIITYCTWPNEHTSARAAFLLLHNGFPRVSAIVGGLDAWIELGFPVEP